MTLLRNLTSEEIQDLITSGARSRTKASPQLKALRALKPGDGILLSHEGINCKNGNCGFRQMLTRLNGQNPRLRYIYSHTDGLNSNTMVACIGVKEEAP